MSVLFDRKLLQQRRDRAVSLLSLQEKSSRSDFLKYIASDIICESLSLIRRSFSHILDLGSHQGQLSDALLKELHPQCLVSADLSFKMLATQHQDILKLQADEEHLPFANHSFDAVVSGLSLHYVNDFVGTLIQIYRILKPDGIAVLAFMGGETLHELRICLKEAEILITGGLSPRIAPMIDVKDAGDLVQRAGFRLSSSVSEKIIVEYETPLHLLKDLQRMGETNILLEREKRFLKRSVLLKACELYTERYKNPETGNIYATFDIIILTGWHDHASQQKPLSPRGKGI